MNINSNSIHAREFFLHLIPYTSSPTLYLPHLSTFIYTHPLHLSVTLICICSSHLCLICTSPYTLHFHLIGEKGIWSSFTKPDCTGVRSSFNFTPGLCYDDFKIQVMQITTPEKTSISTPKNKDDVKNCFAGSETVKLESGEDRQISQIVAGDRVLSADVKGRLTFSEVVFVPHSANRDSAVFVHITTASGRDIKMTKSHVLPAGACGSSSPLPLKHTSQVTVNDCVTTVTGEERVLSVGTTLAEGLYTIVTKEEFVVVNGIIASPFAHNHALGNLYYHIHRFLYDTAPYLLLSPFFGTLNEVSTVDQTNLVRSYRVQCSAVLFFCLSLYSVFCFTLVMTVTVYGVTL